MTAKVGVFGGSFDPVHNGHVITAMLAAEILTLDRLVVVPAHRSPHKPGVTAASPADRLEMARLAFADIARCEVSPVEVDRPPPSYTIDTLRTFAPTAPGARFTLLLGLDSLVDLPRWREAAAIARLCRVAVFRRPGHAADGIDDARRALPGLDAVLVDVPEIGISATDVRNRAAARLPLVGFVPDAVRAYIARRGLYAR